MPKNVTRTVRLDDVLDRAIQEKAKEANTSVNFLVNRLIRNTSTGTCLRRSSGWARSPPGS